MNFKRVELIFLLAFLLLNMFLFGTYRQGIMEIKEIPESNLSDNIEFRLQEDDIKYKGNFSKEKKSGYYLSSDQTEFLPLDWNQLNAQQSRVDNQQFISKVQKNRQPQWSGKHLKKESSEFVEKKENIIFGKDYKYCVQSSQTEGQICFTQNWEGVPINDETAKIVLHLEKEENNQFVLTDYTQMHIENIEPLREKQELISEREAIITLYMNSKFPTRSKIKWTQLAYTRIFTVRDKNVYIPAWFVGIENDKQNLQIERVNAFTNAVLSSTVSEVKN